MKQKKTTANPKLLLAGLVVMAIALLVGMKLVAMNQENRSDAKGKAAAKVAPVKSKYDQKREDEAKSAATKKASKTTTSSAPSCGGSYTTSLSNPCNSSSVYPNCDAGSRTATLSCHWNASYGCFAESSGSSCQSDPVNKRCINVTKSSRYSCDSSGTVAKPTIAPVKTPVSKLPVKTTTKKK
jgi:hypothetical protein